MALRSERLRSGGGSKPLDGLKSKSKPTGIDDTQKPLESVPESLENVRQEHARLLRRLWMIGLSTKVITRWKLDSPMMNESERDELVKECLSKRRDNHARIK